MNIPLRRLGMVIGVMLVALMLSTTAVQFFQAPSLNANAFNVRTTYRQYAVDRGPIVVAGENVAWSEATGHELFQFQRVYAPGELYAHLTGYFSVAQSASTGIERAEGAVLGGTADSLLLSRVQDLFTGRQPQGGSVELTIDPAVQEAIATALGDQRGAAVAIDPRTGALLGMYSSPSYDPNLLAVHQRGEADTNYEALLGAEGRPLENRATGGIQYAPGSTFKVIMSAAWLEADPERHARSEVPTLAQFPLPGSDSVIRNPAGQACGVSDTGELIYAFRNSCNTTFAEMAIELGYENVHAMTEALGFSSDLTVPLPVQNSAYPPVDGDAELAMTGIGQLNVRTSVLQNALVAAAVANDGVLMRPYLVATERDADLSVIREASPSELSQPFSEQTAETLTEMMVSVVNEGTGQPAQLAGVQIAAKTGTAESGTDAPQHAWMIAFAPAEDPQVAVALVLEHGGALGTDAYGGSAAGPLVRDIIRAAVQ
ncbi:MAG: penicillin-binding transpeptidase domain-containing protein [bacterium]|nr:penicillin-binding transpeptidase domain-containing protein [bacterium]